MERRKLEELNLLDDFLFQEAVTRGEKGEEFCRILLKTILGKEIGRVKVIPQKSILGTGTDSHGIKIDAYIEADSTPQHPNNDIPGIEVQTDIYDIEPNKYKSKNDAKRARYYHSLIDAKVLRSGTDYHELKNVVIIMILPYDPFGRNRMVYTFENHCREDGTIECNDGAKTIYLYTGGTEGNPGEELKNMLKYIEETTLENAMNETLKNLHEYVEEIRHDEEVGVSYMKACELEMMYREQGVQEGIQQGIEALILDNLEENISREKIISKLQRHFELPLEKAEMYYEKFSRTENI